MTALDSIYQHSEAAQGQLQSLIHRILDIKDWFSRHPIPEGWNVLACADADAVRLPIVVTLCFDSKEEALLWASLHCRCHDARYGSGAMERITDPPALSIPMPDFTLQLSYQ